MVFLFAGNLSRPLTPSGRSTRRLRVSIWTWAPAGSLWRSIRLSSASSGGSTTRTLFRRTSYKCLEFSALIFMSFFPKIRTRREWYREINVAIRIQSWLAQYQWKSLSVLPLWIKLYITFCCRCCSEVLLELRLCIRWRTVWNIGGEKNSIKFILVQVKNHTKFPGCFCYPYLLYALILTREKEIL